PLTVGANAVAGRAPSALSLGSRSTTVTTDAATPSAVMPVSGAADTLLLGADTIVATKEIVGTLSSATPSTVTVADTVSATVFDTVKLYVPGALSVTAPADALPVTLTSNDAGAMPSTAPPATSRTSTVTVDTAVPSAATLLLGAALTLLRPADTAPVTVNASASVMLPPPGAGFVAVMLRTPGVASAAAVTFAVSDVGSDT